jgi:hypothetical protein
MTTHVKNVPVQIDGHHHELPEQTTGAVLYATGHVKTDYDLFREVKGPGDDELIANSQEPVHLHPGDQFYSAKRTLNPGA